MQREMASLCDIYNAAREALVMIEGLSREQFIADRKTQLAVLHLITLIGEATRRIDVNFRIQYANLPWPQMIGMRNKVIHEYDNVDLLLVWDVLINDIPLLVARIEPILPPK